MAASAPRDASVRVVIDPVDDGQLTAELDRRAEPAAGVVVVHPVPRLTTPNQLGVDLLVALGKPSDAVDREGCTRRQAWHLARIWLEAERVRHLVVLDAENLPPELWTLLVEVTSSLRARLWLLVRRMLPRHLGDRFPLSTATVTELLGAVPAAGPPPADTTRVDVHISDGTYRSCVRGPGPTADGANWLPPTYPDDFGYDLAARFRRHATPAYACALALAAAADLTAEDMAQLHLGDVHPDGDRLSLVGHNFAVPHHAAGLVRAQVLARTQATTDPADSLFVSRLFRFGATRWASPAQITHWLRQVTSYQPNGTERPRRSRLPLLPRAKPGEPLLLYPTAAWEAVNPGALPDTGWEDPWITQH